MRRVPASLVLLSTLILLLSFATPGQAGLAVSDDFSGATLNPFWTFVDPLNDASATLTGNTGTADAWINIAMPGGIAHDAFFGNDAPRLIQPVDDVDFQIEVRMESAIAGAFKFQGIYVEQDASNWIRIDINSNATDHRALAVTVSGGTPTLRHNQTINAGASPTPFWLRLTRSADQWTQEYSADGLTWTVAGTPFTHALAVSQVGLMAGNAAGATSPALTASFDYFFRTDDPVVPEDPVTCGNGALDGGEECDDNNTDPGDGCSASCIIEPEFQCIGEPSVCTQVPAVPAAGTVAITVLVILLLGGLGVLLRRSFATGS